MCWWSNEAPVARVPGRWKKVELDENGVRIG